MANGNTELITDLSEGQVTDQQKELFVIERAQRIQQRDHQKLAFFAALGFCLLMTIGFLWFAYKVICFVAADWSFDWHLLLFGSAFIVPPTIILFALIRRLYPLDKSKGDRERADELPVSGLSAELVSMMKEVTELVGAVTKRIEPPSS